jgi:predicted DNA-binding transcriptional regulator YafY
MVGIELRRAALFDNTPPPLPRDARLRVRIEDVLLGPTHRLRGGLNVDRTERFYKIHQLLEAHRAVSLEAMREALGVSRATVVRDLEYLRDRLAAPIVWDRERRGYRFEAGAEGGPRYALPGLWLNASEAHALLLMDSLLAELQPGLLGGHVEPLRRRIRLMLDSTAYPSETILRRIRLVRTAGRPVDAGHFPVIATTLLRRKRLAVVHYNRRTDETLGRELSPQRLVYYRDNWYLDAWCHLREALRSFSLDAFERVEALERRAKDVAEKALNATLGAGYGIFGGAPGHTAVLRFTPERARWVALERWHPEQQGEFDAEGRYVLSVPYADATELVLDVLRYGPEVEVLAPPELRETVRERLRQALAVYGD